MSKENTKPLIGDVLVIWMLLRFQKEFRGRQRSSLIRIHLPIEPDNKSNENFLTQFLIFFIFDYFTQPGNKPFFLKWPSWNMNLIFFPIQSQLFLIQMIKDENLDLQSFSAKKKVSNGKSSGKYDQTRELTVSYFETVLLRFFSCNNCVCVFECPVVEKHGCHAMIIPWSWRNIVMIMSSW